MSELVLKNLTVTYPNGKDANTILDSLDLRIGEGEFVCLLGSSGCGKSTLLGTIAGLIKPHDGTIHWNGRQVTGPGLERSMVFQHYSLFPWMTAQRNLIFALEAAGQSKSACASLAQQFLELVGLAPYSDYFPRQMSGGMQQRLALARSFAMNAQILLLDEPFGALDALTRTYLQDLLLTLWEHSRKTILMVTHDVDEALLLADRVIVMEPGTGKLKEDRRITFERPRRREQLHFSASYQTIRLELLHLLQQELLEELASQQSQVRHLWDALNGGETIENDYTI